MRKLKIQEITIFIKLLAADPVTISHYEGQVGFKHTIFGPQAPRWQNKSLINPGMGLIEVASKWGKSKIQ